MTSLAESPKPTLLLWRLDAARNFVSLKHLHLNLNLPLSVLMLCAPSNRRRPFSYEIRVFSCFVRFLLKKKLAYTQKGVLNMASSGCQIDKPQCGCPKRAELSDVNTNTGAQSINTERASLMLNFGTSGSCSTYFRCFSRKKRKRVLS